MRNWSFRQWFIAIVVLCALVALLFIGIPAMGIPIPAFVVSMLWVLGVAIALLIIGGILFSFWDGGGPSPPA